MACGAESRRTERAATIRADEAGDGNALPTRGERGRVKRVRRSCRSPGGGGGGGGRGRTATTDEEESSRSRKLFGVGPDGPYLRLRVVVVGWRRWEPHARRSVGAGWVGASPLLCFGLCCKLVVRGGGELKKKKKKKKKKAVWMEDGEDDEVLVLLKWNSGWGRGLRTKLPRSFLGCYYYYYGLRRGGGWGREAASGLRWRGRLRLLPTAAASAVRQTASESMRVHPEWNGSGAEVCCGCKVAPPARAARHRSIYQWKARERCPSSTVASTDGARRRILVEVMATWQGWDGTGPASSLHICVLGMRANRIHHC